MIFSTSFQNTFTSISLPQEKAPASGSVDSFDIMRIGPDQGLYLIGEDHSFDRIAQKENAYNFLILELLLLQAEKDEVKRTYHVFVEHRANLFRTCAPNKVPANMMRGLLPLAQKAKFKHVTVESCEIRKIIGAMQSLMHLYPTPETANTYPAWESLTSAFQETFGFGITTLKFRDIISEFERLSREMREYMDQWDDPLIKKEFRKSLHEAEYYFAYLRGYLEGKNLCETSIITDGWLSFPVTAPTEFDLDETLFSFCCKDPEKRFLPFFCWVEYHMILGFMNFVDLYLFHRVLELRKEEDPIKKIIVVAGADHCHPLTWQLLRTASGQRVYGLISSQEKFTIRQFVKVKKPLNEIEEQEKLKRESWCVLL